MALPGRDPGSAFLCKVLQGEEGTVCLNSQFNYRVGLYYVHLLFDLEEKKCSVGDSLSLLRL